MNTTFSLVYFNCHKNTSNLLSALNGPFLFDSLEAAQEKLSDYIRNRIADKYPDAIGQYAETCGVDLFGFTDDQHDPISTHEVYLCLVEHKDFFTLKRLVDWYSDTSSHEGIYFSYKIEEMPTTSFLEELRKANAIEIEGNVIKDVDVTPIEKSADTGVLMQVPLIDTNMDAHEHKITLPDAQNATYDVQHKHWIVGDVKFRLFNNVDASDNNPCNIRVHDLY